ncbi:MAG: Zn-ribbon domain-containing OB-fold protein [Acidimicrobiales bacterium]
MNAADRPKPAKDNVSREYWEAAARGELLIQLCPVCGHRQHYPRAVCTACGATPEWERASGNGNVYTFTVIRQNYAKPFRDELPYVIGMVDLEEGPRIYAGITDVEPDAVHIGMPVEVWFADAGDEIGIPFFRPRTEAAP